VIKRVGWDQPTTGLGSPAGIQIAVATLQKSTARRLVSICADLERTYLMLFMSSPDVTPSRTVLEGGTDRRDHVGLTGLSGGPARDGAIGSEHEHRGRGADAQPARKIEPGGRVDLDHRHAVELTGDLREDLSRRPAPCAEGGRELHQSGSLTQRRAEIGLGQHAVPERPSTRTPSRPHPPLPALIDDSYDRSGRQRGRERDHPTHHARVQRAYRAMHSRRGNAAGSGRLLISPRRP
jgi:hypothetical protein